MGPPLSASEDRRPLEEKLLLGLVWDETKLEFEGVIYGELVEELASV